jgi:glycosyltransferase involved in cell wall biosynthesis
MFTNTYLPHIGGVARSVNIFSEDLRKMGHRVLIIAPVYPGCEEYDTADSDVLRVPAIQHFTGGDFSMRIPAPFYIDEKMDDFKPDIIHSHHPYLLGDSALRAAKRRRLPLVFTHHTLYEEYTHYVTKDSESMRRFAAILSTKYANMCDRVVAPSKSIEKLIRQRGVETKIIEIPTGVDTDFFSSGKGTIFRKKFGIPESAFIIGHLGRLAPEKNLDFLATAISMAMKDLPDTVFLVSGDGPSKSDIHEIFQESGLNDRLVLTGSVTGIRLADAYHAMDLFVFSSHSETQGMVLTEAMAAGTPVIALDAPGAREVVQDDKNGLLLASDSRPETFSAAVRDAVLNPEKIKKWRQSTIKTAQAFSREVCAVKLQQVYESAIARTESQSPAASDDMDPWDSFLLAIQTEWDLIAQKAETIIETIRKKQ